MQRFIKENSLSLVLFGLFFFSLVGQYLTGWQEHNSDQIKHDQPVVTAIEYLAEGHFWEAIFENWESEFLQMTAFIMLTVFLTQKGAADSRKPGAIERNDVIPGRGLLEPDAPWPVRKGGLWLKLYENSLSLALFALFTVSFIMHGVGGMKEHNAEQAVHGGQQLTLMEYMESSRFWFESFQNWQSEFLSIGVILIFSIYLRQKGSPESKPVDAPHFDTGK